jgi:hypothetical protein
MKNSNLDKEQIAQSLQNKNFFSLDNFTIKINQDDSPDSPRNWDNLGKMVCFHRRYDLGDKHNFTNAEAFDQFAKIEEGELVKYVKLSQSLKNHKATLKNKSNLIILPLYLYDHSGITIATTHFHCPWDSGQIGYIYAKRNQENLSEEQIKEILINEVKIYDQYLRGEVLSFEVLKNDQFMDGVFGYYDKIDCINEAISSFEGVFIKSPPQTIQLSLFD